MNKQKFEIELTLINQLTEAESFYLSLEAKNKIKLLLEDIYKDHKCQIQIWSFEGNKND